MGHIHRFKALFRISKQTFLYILSFIEDGLQREYLCEAPISPKERLAICLYRLSRGDYYHTISEMTGKGVSTVRNITQEVCDLIIERLWKKFVIFPENERNMMLAINKMESLWQFPGGYAGVDGCHIPLKCPHGGNEARKE